MLSMKCVVPGCNMQRTRKSDRSVGVRFFPIPAIREIGPPWTRMRSTMRRRAWLFIINNEDLKDEYAGTSMRICSRHFISGKPAALRDERNPDWLPSLHIGTDTEPSSRRTYPKRHTIESVGKSEDVHHVNIPQPTAVSNTNIASVLRKGELSETYSAFLTIKEEIKEEPPDTELQHNIQDSSNERSPLVNDMVTVRCDDYKIMEEELQRMRNENAELKKSYTKLRNQLTEADVDKLELNSELSGVRRASEDILLKNRSLVEENVFLTNKIISCETLIKTLQDEAKSRVNRIATLEYSVDKLKRISVCIEALKEDEDYVTFYTGLPFYQTFEMSLNHVRCRVNEIRCVLAPWQCFLLTLIRLRLSLTLQDLAYRFGISKSTVCNTFERWLYYLYQSLDSFIVRTEREDIKRFMTDSFKEAFSDKVVMILHCFELLSDSSKAADNKGASHPSSKHRNSIKYFIGMIPCGAISFVSRGWETTSEAEQVLEESSLYETLHPGDEILCDHGLPTCESVGWCCAKVMESNSSSQVEFRCQDITDSRRLSMLRGQIERIGSLRRKYRILRGELPIQDLHKKTVHDVPQIDQIVRVCCALSNIAESNV